MTPATPALPLTLPLISANGRIFGYGAVKAKAFAGQGRRL